MYDTSNSTLFTMTIAIIETILHYYTSSDEVEPLNGMCYFIIIVCNKLSFGC